MGQKILSKRFVFVILFSFFLTTNLTYQTTYAQTDKLEKLEAYISTAIKDWNVPGLAIAIVKDEQVVYMKGFGYTSIKSRDSVDKHTLFAIASNTKAFTAAALGLLVQEGKLSWDDPVLKYIPDFQLYDPIITRKIAIRDLLCHRSGLGLWAGDLTWWDSVYDREEVIRRIRYQEPVSDFRTSYHYTNLMFLVAGEIIPQVTGISWDQFIKQRFFDELNMNRSTTSVNDLLKMKNIAMPHTILNGDLIEIEYMNVDNSGPAGAINSSVDDMSRWVQLQLNNGIYGGKKLVDSKIILETRKPHTMIIIEEKTKSLNPFTLFSAYGLGFRTNDYRGRLVVNHTGGLDGMYSYVGFMPEEKLGMIILTNLDNHKLHTSLPLYVYDLFLDVEVKDWSKIYLEDFEAERQKNEEQKKEELTNKAKDTKPTLALGQYTGTYTSEIYGKAYMSEEGGQLKLRLSAHPKHEAIIEHWHYDTFLAKWNHKLWGESYLYFKYDGDGKITKFLMSVRPDWLDTLEYSFVRSD